MAELTAADVEEYTGGRLDRDDAGTGRLLKSGLGAARRRCRWHVYPLRLDVPVLDGPAGRLLRLPTMRLVELQELTEDGIVVPPSDIDVSMRGMVEKRSGAFWTRRFSGITAKMLHGYGEDDVPEEFNSAVLSIIDRASYAPAGGRPRVVGPFQYDIEKSAGGWTDQERAWLEPFRLEKPA